MIVERTRTVVGKITGRRRFERYFSTTLNVEAVSFLLTKPLKAAH